MKTKAHILIVEDEALLYKRMKTVLLREHFSVADYTPSVTEALEQIQKHTPDIVLLDINLQGEATGIDLGKILHEQYGIPFIYVTEFDDDHTFYKGLATQHEHFIVKTKPRLNPTEIIRAIYTVLQKQEKQKTQSKQGIIGLVDYLSNLKGMGEKTITRVPVPYEQIAFFTTDTLDNGDKLRKNYIWLSRTDGKYFFLKSSLKELLQHLPAYFVQISDCYVVNISPSVLQGRINGVRLSVMDRELTINRGFLNNVNKRIELFYK